MTQIEIDKCMLDVTAINAKLEAAIAQGAVLNDRLTKHGQRIAVLEATVHNQQVLITETTGYTLELSQKLAEHIMPD